MFYKKNIERALFTTCKKRRIIHRFCVLLKKIKLFLFQLKALNIDIDLIAFDAGHQKYAFSDFILNLIADFDDVAALLDSDGDREDRFTGFCDLAVDKIVVFLRWIDVFDIAAGDRCHIFKCFFADNIRTYFIFS